MKTKLRYNHAVNFGNFDIDALEAYLPREIEIEQNEEFEFLEVDLKIKLISFKIEENDSFDYRTIFTIEGKIINIHLITSNYINQEAFVKEMLEYYSEDIKNQITNIIKDCYSDMVDAIKGNQDNEIEKQKTEEFIRKHF